MSKLNTVEETEIARILLALPKPDPKTGRRPRGSMTPEHKKLMKRMLNLMYSRDHKVELATKGRQYYAAKKAALGLAVKHRIPTPPLPKRRKLKLLQVPQPQPQAKPGWLQRLFGIF